MKHFFKIIFPLLAVVFITFGCTQDNDLMDQAENNPAMDVKTYRDLEFNYRVTDMEGNPQKSFEEGENFMFSFRVINHADTDRFLGPWLDVPTDDDFFSVYKKENIGNEKSRIGKSYRLGGNTLDLRPQVVPKNEEIEYRIPWLTQVDRSYFMPIYVPEKDIINKRGYLAVEPLPEPLPSGEYYSGFTLEFEGKEIKFAIKFVVN